MKLILIRHGETASNTKGIHQGQKIDDDLNDTGIKQSEEVIAKLPANIDLIFSSPLLRSKRTGEIINQKLHVEFKLDDRLKEIDFGSMTGKTWPEMELIEPGIKETHYNLQSDFRKFGGESVEDLKTRVKNFIDEIKIQYPDKTILVSAHNGVIRSTIFLLTGKVQHHFENASFYEFDL